MALVVLIFLLHGRSALVPLLTLPLVVLLTFAAMRLFGIPATVMSLGGIAIALGMAVDAELVALEACHRRLETDPGGGISGASPWRRRRLVEAAGAFAPAILTSLLIAALAFVPVFAFGGETGRLAAPAGARQDAGHPAGGGRHADGRARAARSPAARPHRAGAGQSADAPAGARVSAVRALRAVAPDAHAGDRRRWRRCPACRSFRAWAASSCPASTKAISSTCPPPRPASATTTPRSSWPTQDRLIAKHPGIDAVYGKIGRAETATDPAPLSMAETTIRLKPRSEWPRVERRRWYSGWAPRPLKRVLGLVWPESQPMTTAELIDSLDKRRASRAGRTPGRRRCGRAST